LLVSDPHRSLDAQRTWFTGVSVSAGSLVGGVIAVIIWSSWSVGTPPSALTFTLSGLAIGGILAVTGCVGTIIGASLLRRRTRSIALLALTMSVVAAGLMLALVNVVGGLGAGESSAVLVILGIAALLSTSAVSPWRGGFARPAPRLDTDGSHQ
jgi:hypothetical protein